MNCLLVDQLKEYGLEGLVPEGEELEISLDTDYYELDDRNTRTDCFGRVYEAEIDEGEEDFLYDADQDEWFENPDNRPESYLLLDDLQSMFDDYCYENQEDFVKLNLWELIGIKKNQLNLVPWDKVTDWLFVTFVNTFRKDKRNISLDKKLLYSAVEAQTSYSRIELNVEGKPEPSEIRQYCERIIDHHSFDESAHLLQLLEDYYRFYADAITMNERRKENGEQVFKYEIFPKPNHLQDLHNKAFRDHVSMETERMNANQSDLSRKIEMVSETLDYKKFLFKDEEFTVLPVTSQIDLNEEGTALKHCVASYGSYMAGGNSYIFRIRENKNLDNALYTAEITPEDIRTHEVARLKQCYGYKDTTVKTENLRKFIIKWANERKFRIACVV